MGASRILNRITLEQFGVADTARLQIPAGPRDNDERRADPRYACDYPANVISPDRRIFLTGRITNISASGAKVAAAFPKNGPSTIFLVDLAHGDVYECDVRWRSEGSIGVRFVDMLGGAKKRKLFAGERLGISGETHAINEVSSAPDEKTHPGPPPDSFHSGLAHAPDSRPPAASNAPPKR